MVPQPDADGGELDESVLAGNRHRSPGHVLAQIVSPESGPLAIRRISAVDLFSIKG
jgi:hypothetical protein